jgi:hypothetical protein
MRPLVAHCYLGLSKLYLRTSKPEQARKNLTAATTMYREMDMDSGLSRAKDPGPQVQHSAKVAARPFIRPSHTLSGLSVLLTIPHSSV